MFILPENLLQRLVNALRMQDQANGQQMEHLVRLLVNLVVLVRTRVVKLRRTLDVEQDRRERTNGVRVATHHHVGKTYVVRGGDLARRDVRVTALLVDLDWFEDLCRGVKLKCCSMQ